MKKIILFIVMIFSLSFFYGCRGQEQPSLKGGYVYSEIASFSDGQIVQTVGVSVDGENLKLSASQSEITAFTSCLVKEMENVRQKFVLQFAVVYLNNPIEELKIGQGVKVSQCAYKAESDLVAFEICFTSSAAWQYYHNIQDATQSAPQKEGDDVFLLEKRENSGTFPFAVQDAAGQALGLSYKNIYLKASSGFSFEEEVKKGYSPQFIYNYSTFSSTIKSDADVQIKSDNGQYNHIWIRDESQLNEDVKTCIYYYKANKGMWILLAVAIPSACLLVWSIVVKVKNTKKKTKD